MMIWPRCSELLRMDPVDLVVFSPFLFLELPKLNLRPLGSPLIATSIDKSSEVSTQLHCNVIGIAVLPVGARATWLAGTAAAALVFIRCSQTS